MPDPYKDLTFDFHLMVKNYEEHIKKINSVKKLINIKNIFIHYDLHPNYSLFTNHYSLLNIGLTLNPQDQVSDLISHYPLNTIYQRESVRCLVLSDKWLVCYNNKVYARMAQW